MAGPNRTISTSKVCYVIKKIECWTVLSCKQLRAKDDKCPQDGRRGQTHGAPKPSSPYKVYVCIMYICMHMYTVYGCVYTYIHILYMAMIYIYTDLFKGGSSSKCWTLTPANPLELCQDRDVISPFYSTWGWRELWRQLLTGLWKDFISYWIPQRICP